MSDHDGQQRGWSTPDTASDSKTGTTVCRYLASRLPTLKPPMDRMVNPIKAMRSLNKEQWTFFAVAWCGWVMDSFDFFTVSLTLTNLADTFHKKESDITWGISLVLMLRPVGAIFFGAWGDRYGRKWPFIVNNIMFIAFELGTGFCHTYGQFLAIRSMFGIAMGGLYGNAVATALEDCPDAARGIMSGLFQGGYPFGYLLATAMARALVDTTSHGWRPLFWFSAGPPVFLIVWRYFLPETQTFRERQMLRKSTSEASTPGFFAQAGAAIRRYWLVLIYMIVFMAGFSYMSHGSQDMYPTLLVNQYNFSDDMKTVTQVVANIGAVIGAVVVGNLSEMFGRRLTIIAACAMAGALLYPYTFVSTPAIMAAAFFVQFAIQGAFGVVPSHLMELSPPDLRAFVVGTAYQLGSLASSPAATIQSEIAEDNFPLSPGPNGRPRYNYAEVICAVLGAALGVVIIVTFLGPENKGARFSMAGIQAVAKPGSSPASSGPLDKEKEEEEGGGA
ncbi:hypothetical protein CDD83_3376 [Cordyceps sp. RAO-2017]|nr:hypothetical protein CDD83_3376 [Cordyceps sp. RAO-2017]